jgi:phosphatidylglycerophosphatase A
MLKRLLTSCLGLGWLPIAPGTWGSLPVAVAFGLLTQFGATPVVTFVVMCGFIAAGSVICVLCAPAAIKAVGKDDPGEVVADELAGQAVTFLYLPLSVADGMSAGESWALAGAGFVLFRLFDIIKPWPIRKLERLPAGWGILADDLLAGVFAAVVLQAAWMLRLADMFARN